MSDPDHPKPTPVRPPKTRGKPTPVRELNGDPSPPPAEIDVAEVGLDVDDRSWTVRVLGRSGGGSGSTPPLLLLGFWTVGDGERPSREALVVGRSLTNLAQETLRTALSGASEPRDPERKPPFFAGTAQNRRR